MPELGPELTRELLYRTQLDGTQLAEALDGTQMTLLEHEAEILHEQLRTPQPRVYLDAQKDVLLFSLVPLHHMKGAEAREFDDLHEAIRSAVYRRRSAKTFLDEKKELQRRLHQVGERAARSLRGIPR